MAETSPNKIYTNTAEHSAKTVEKDRKRKATEKAKESRRRSKYQRIDDTPAARRAYNRYDEGISPDEVTDDIPLDQLKQLCEDFYRMKVITTEEQAKVIEYDTRQQSDCAQWLVERRQASNVGSIAKMRATTKKGNRVKELLYSSFRGNEATRYGSLKEPETLQQYLTHQQRNGHLDLKVEACGLFVSLSNPWLAASPDGCVLDPSNPDHPLGLLEMKNPFQMRDKTISEACANSSFCLEERNNKFNLKHKHNYYYQIQCQLYCTNREWCDFVLRTNKDFHIERIYRDNSWWKPQLDKLQEFFFTALLPELASPRHRKGGIREP